MTSRLFLLQIIFFCIAFTIARAGGELKQQSNPDLIGPSSVEDDAKEQENRLNCEESSEQRSQVQETEKAVNMTLSFTKVTDESSTTTTDSVVKPSATQVFITAPKENFPQASSASTMGRDVAEAASTTLSTDLGSADEKTTATMRPSTSTEKDVLLDTTTEAFDFKSSTLKIIITATKDSTQRDSTVTPRKDISESTSAMLSDASTSAEQSSTEEVNVTMILPSASTKKDEPFEITTEASEFTHSTSPDVFTQSSEKSTSQSVISMRREVPETVSRIPSTSTSTRGTRQALTDEMTTATMLSFTAREIDQNLNATTEGSNLQRSTSQVVFSSTVKSTQADPIATTKRDVFKISTSMQTTASTTEEMKDAASKASTSIEGTLSTATVKEASPFATTKRTFLENDDPAVGTSTVLLSTTAIPSPIEASVSTISSTSTVTSPITPTIPPSTETDHSHSTSTPLSSTIIPESTSKEVPSTTTSARPTTAELRTCVDATRIGNRRINCSIYRKMCRKQGYNNMLKKYCPVTCGYCKLCVDQTRNRKNICTQRIQNTLRMCNHRSLNIRANTRKRCPVTCGICSKGSVLLLR